MVLEFLSEADASSAFKINNAGNLLNKIKEHPLFDKFEINRYARPALPPRVCCEGKLWVPFSYFTHENNITLKYNNQYNEELTLFLEKENERINATSIVKNKYVEDGTDAFYFVDAFQEVMFDAYFLKE